MSSKGFHIQYKVLDKSPIGICYTLVMTYQEHTEYRADVILPSMHISHEIILSIREHLHAIQDQNFLILNTLYILLKDGS